MVWALLHYNTTVSDAMEICFVIIHHVLIDPEFIRYISLPKYRKENSNTFKNFGQKTKNRS